jgi:general secretion pathway protein K
MAMLTVTLVASLAAAGLWQQWRAAETEKAERSRTQSAWLLVGALDWARLILREDARSGGADHLAEPWAVPLEEARLSTFLSADQQVTDDQRDAFLSGSIVDLQGRLNVGNLIEGKEISATGVRTFEKFFEHLGLPVGQVRVMAEALHRAAIGTTGTDGKPPAGVPLMPSRVDDLLWLGVSEQNLERLRPYISLLPERTPLNINTASAAAIHATVPWLDMAQAQRLVTERQRNAFRSLAEAARIVPGLDAVDSALIGVSTRYFEVRGRLRLDDLIVEERSLVQRDGLTVRTRWRERVPVAPAT